MKTDVLIAGGGLAGLYLAYQLEQAGIDYLLVEARMAIFEFIEAWYNPHRRHKALGQKSPINFERSYQQAA